MKTYKISVQLDSSESRNSVHRFVMRSLSDAIARGPYDKYREDMIKVRLEGEEESDSELSIPRLIAHASFLLFCAGSVVLLLGWIGLSLFGEH